jgi:hypothetical protein
MSMIASPPPCPTSRSLPRACRCLLGMALALAVGGLSARVEKDEAAPKDSGPEIATDTAATCLTTPAEKGLRVLILADSMGIGGWAEELDACFRACPGVAAVHTIVACGANPLTWMKMAPYAHASTRCGFLRMETVAGKSKPDQEKDFYGMTKGHKPAAHKVPKIEDLMERIKPEIVVFQNGNNFFDFFKEGRIIKEETHRKLIRAHVAPLIRWLATHGSSVRKFYWVSPAQAGNVTPEVQQFVFDCMNTEVTKIGVMLDSRTITSYPYKNQEKDKMHFYGQAALDWGDDTFRLIATDLAANDITSALVLTERHIDLSGTPAQVPKGDEVTLRLRLKAMTPVPAPQSFAPYGEFMVGYLYDVLEVKSGKYDEKEMLIFHPAYIKHVRQDLSRYKLKREIAVMVSEIGEDSLWATVHRKDSVGPPELYPYMILEDVARHPDSPDCHSCDR